MYVFNKEEVLKDWEMKLVWDTYFEEGVGAGIEEGKIKAQKKLAKNMLDAGLAVEMIEKLTGLTAAEIENLTDESFDDE
jgi:predicted transposase/invertase (TIGR01784 family)